MVQAAIDAAVAQAGPMQLQRKNGADSEHLRCSL